jgi:hypothetical protein
MPKKGKKEDEDAETAKNPFAQVFVLRLAQR